MFVIPSIFKAVDQYTTPVRTMSAATQTLAERAEIANVRTQRTFGRVADSIDGAIGKVINLGNAIAVTAGIAATKKIYDLAADTASFADELSTTASRIGITTQAYQELSYASKLQNIEEETLTKSLEKLNKNLGDLHKNQGTLEGALKKSNPALMAQLKHAKDASEAFDIVSAAIVKLPNQMDRAALAQAAFGKAGQQMLNLIQVGPENIQKMREEAHKLGIVLSNEAVEAAGKFDDANDRMQFTISGLKNSIGAQLMPVVQGYIEKATSWAIAHRELIKEKVQSFVDGIANAVRFLSENYDTIKTGMTWFIGGLIALKVAAIAARTWMMLTAISTGIYNTYLLISSGSLSAATVAQWALNAAMLASPVTWITLAIIALIAIIVAVALKTEGWGKQWDATIKWMKSIFRFFVLGLTLQFQAIQLYFWTMVNAVVIAWKWGQNKLGLISDEQFARDKARIQEEQRMRVEAIKKTATEMAAAGAEAVAGPGWHIKMKGEEQATQQEAPTITPINPKYQQQQMMQQVMKGSMSLVQKNTAEITIKDKTGSAEVSKNPSNMPIKIDSDVMGKF